MPYNILLIVLSLSVVLLFVAILQLMREKRHNLYLIDSLKRERERNRSYIEDLDNLLALLTRFQELGMAHTKVDDLENFCKLIVDYSTELLNTKMGSLMLIKKATNELEIVAARGLSDDVVDHTHMNIGEGISGRVAQEGKPIFCENIERDVRFMRHSKEKYASNSFITVPLKVKQKVIGVLNVNSKKTGRKFNQRDMRMLSILGDQAAVAIENIQLYNDLKEMYLGTIQTLAQAIDEKDPYSKGHTKRVAEYAVQIAKKMNLPQKLVRNIEYAALIHDIGKIGIKDSVLNKPARLSDAEYETIKKHPRIGERILAPVEFLTNVAPLVLYHHEHYDGNGYMEGLKGEEIPVGARILNAADSYEAMTSNRPYSKGMSKEKAIEELKDKSGSQFDPAVINAFLNILEENDPSEDTDNGTTLNEAL